MQPSLYPVAFIILETGNKKQLFIVTAFLSVPKLPLFSFDDVSQHHDFML